MTIRKRIQILNGDVILSAEQAQAECLNAISNNILGNTSFLATEEGVVMGSVTEMLDATELRTVATALV